MKYNTFIKKSDQYTYENIYIVFRKYFQFDENKYEYLIKDIIKVLMEFEKKGETIIDVDNIQINFDLYNDNWPNEHLKCLRESGLKNLSNSPIVNNGRKISWSKWSTKLERVTKILLNKINLQDKDNLKLESKENKIEEILDILKFSNLVLLQGGPGTGKTTLVINLLSSFFKAKTNLNIGLSAPTGKATARIKEALNNNLDYSELNLFTLECQTLHSWIYNTTNASKLKLRLTDLDFFIIDECSMLSIDIFEIILECLNTDCKIILVGDSKQLPPINNCSIWNNIFDNMKNSPFEFCTVNLNKIFRNIGDIQELSKLIFNKDQSLFNQKVDLIIKSQTFSNVNINIQTKKNLPNKLVEEVLFFTNELKVKTNKLSRKNYIFKRNIDNLIDYEKDSVLDIFNTLNSQLILCSSNTGKWSVKDVNSIVINENEPFDFLTLEEGIPIMCVENNNELGISNGDIGVLIGENKTRRFLFRKFNKENELIFSLIDPFRLEKIVPALAVTIHKSQGSEAEKVMILWHKEHKSNKANYRSEDFMFFRDNYEKRLFYTGITRAKKNLEIFYLD